MCCSRTQVGQGGHHLGAGSGFQGRMDHRGEEWRVVRRDLRGNGALGDRRPVGVRIRAAHRPVGVRDAEGIGDDAEVLRGGGRFGLVDLTLVEVGFEGLDDPVVGRRVIAGQRELVV